MVLPELNLAFVSKGTKAPDKLRHYRPCSSNRWSKIHVHWPAGFELKEADILTFLKMLSFEKIVVGNEKNDSFSVNDPHIDIVLTVDLTDNQFWDAQKNIKITISY